MLHIIWTFGFAIWLIETPSFLNFLRSSFFFVILLFTRYLDAVQQYQIANKIAKKYRPITYSSAKYIYFINIDLMGSGTLNQNAFHAML